MGWLFLQVLIFAPAMRAQVTITESFTGTTAAGWVFGGSSGSTIPYLTGNTVDTPGNGWLRLSENIGNQATYALFDSAIFSVNAQIQIEFDYTFWNSTSTGADGITFFLVDGGVNASTFTPGGYGGSLGYAQNTAAGAAGMPGGYLGFGLDNYGNYSSASEGRNGGLGGGLYENRVAVRGPESSNYQFIAASAALETLSGGGQMDFPNATTRPNQSGPDYRSFRLTLDANNQLTVEMKFGASSNYITAFTTDLSGFDRPDTFKIGFTGSTGGVNEIHEIRNTRVTTTPWQPGSFEWDNGAGTTAWGNTPGGVNNNWYHPESGSNNRTPLANADILFGNRPTTDQTVTLGVNTQVNSLTFDAGINYTLNGGNTLTLGNTGTVGLPSINVNDYNGAQGRHKINVPLNIVEELRINNYSFSTLCINGLIETGGNDIKVNGHGTTNFNGAITGLGGLIKNGTGIVTINNNNSSWTGPVTINQGMVVVTTNGALGTTAAGTTVNDGGTLAFRDTGSGLNYSTTESVTISGRGIYRGVEGQVGAIYNDGGNTTFAGNITMAANSAIGSRDGVLTLNGAIGGARSFTKLGDGVVVFGANNTYTGATIIEGGALRVSNTNQIDGSNLQLNGGVLEIAGDLDTGNTGEFTRSLGTGTSEVQWTGDGGFSAFGADRTVRLNNGTAQVTWGSGNFVGAGSALLLSSDYATHTLTFANAIVLGNQIREIRVANGSAAVDGTLSGVLSGTGGINKTGEGTLFLNANNTYTGATRISGGALRVGGTNRIDGSNVQLNGGVLEVGFNFSRSLGTGGSNVQWLGDGGFAAYDGNRTVTLGGSGLTWGGTNFVGNNNRLIFGSTSANNNVTLTNALALGSSGSRTIHTVQGTSTAVASGTLSGAVSGSAALAVTGNGRLDLTANNTHTGAVTVRGAELRLSGSGDLAQSSGFTIREGGRLTLDNSNSTVDRVGNSASIALNGGRLDLIGRTTADATTETVGQLQLAGGANTVNVQRSGNNATELAFSSLDRAAGSTVEFIREGGSGTLGDTGNNPRVTFGTSPTLTNGILAYAVYGNGATPTAFATITSGRVTAAAADYESAFTATLNAGMDGTFGMAGDTNRFVNSLLFVNDGNLNMSDRNLDIVSGGILSNSTTGGSIAGNGALFSSSGELITHVYNSGVFTISTTITNHGSNPLDFTKSGTGLLVFAGNSANTYTGTTYVNDGTLALAQSAGVTAIAGNIIVGDGRGTDILRLDANEQIANTANVTLRGSEFGGETILQFNPTSGDGLVETFGNLTIEGRAVIDFAGADVCSPNMLFLDDLLMATGDTELFIRNWIDYTDYLLVRNTADIGSVLSRIHFEGYGQGAYWQEYDAQYSRITPVPEPSTYGAMLVGAGLAFVGYRRWKQGKAASEKKA